MKGERFDGKRHGSQERDQEAQKGQEVEEEGHAAVYITRPHVTGVSIPNFFGLCDFILIDEIERGGQPPR
jgi:hypothetical protein